MTEAKVNWRDMSLRCTILRLSWVDGTLPQPIRFAVAAKVGFAPRARTVCSVWSGFSFTNPVSASETSFRTPWRQAATRCCMVIIATCREEATCQQLAEELAATDVGTTSAIKWPAAWSPPN